MGTVTTVEAGAVVNVRAAPNIQAEIVGQIRTGSTAVRTGASVPNGEHTWAPIAVQKADGHYHGWSAEEVVHIP